MQLHLTQTIIDFCADVIRRLGYPGIFLLMVCESMYVPIPSFAVMPFVGFVAHRVANGDPAFEGCPTFWLGLLAAVLGGLVGSLLTYYFGLFAGPVGVRKLGPYVGLIEEDLDTTQAWFERKGAITVLIARFVPVVRHFISTAAGIARMRIAPFALMTVLGAGLWDLFLAALGWQLEASYPVIKQYQEPIDVLVILVFLAGGVHIFRKLRARMRSRKEKQASGPAPDLDAPREAP
ncbi:DedA family protein [bacterium]|nr:DedA family protein [bacterium]